MAGYVKNHLSNVPRENSKMAAKKETEQTILTVYDADGNSAQIDKGSLSVWEKAGYSTTVPETKMSSQEKIKLLLKSLN